MVLPAAIVCLFFVALVLAICNQQGHPVLFPVVANTRAASSVRKAALPRDQHTGSDLDQQAHLEDDFFSLAPDISEKNHTHFPAVAGKNVDRERQDRVTPSPAATPLTAPPSPMLAVTPSPLLSPAREGNDHISNFSWKQDNDDGDNQTSLESTLVSASVENKTILITELNKAWAMGGMFDLFLRSFHTGEGILHLLDHLLVATLDREASAVCKSKRLHCFRLTTPGLDLSTESNYNTPNYLETNKLKIQFLGDVLKLGYNFLYTDADILWFRAPFQHFSRESDLDVSCNHDFNGNSSDIGNHINTGILHVRSNQRTIKLFDLWFEQQGTSPDKNDQDVFEAMKETPDFASIGLKLKYIPTEYLSGYCHMNTDFEKICAIHAICCISQEVKLAALKQSLEDWLLYKTITPQESREIDFQFTVPECSM